jgi:DNA helicase-2/ATP-dependent DNA helicase PcrA
MADPDRLLIASGVSEPTAAAAAAATPVPPLPAARLPRTARQRSRAAIAAALAEDTDEQQSAVYHGEGPLLVFAGPGTGKTRTLTHRVAHLIDAGIAWPQRIVAMTFTLRAADEMRVRLIKLLGARPAHQVTVCTIHSLCWRMVRAHAEMFGRDGNCQIYNPAELANLARDVLADPAHSHLAHEHHLLNEPRVETLLAEISLAKNGLCSREHYRNNSEDPAAELIAGLWHALELRMRAANAFDLDDLLACSVALLTHDERACAYYREWIEWLLVDEYQDVNPPQREIIRRLKAPHGNLAVFGDDDQSLYGFRLADATSILRFADDYPNARKVKLTRNFRSYAEIVDAANQVIGHNKNREPKQLIAERGPGGWVGSRRYLNDEQEASEVAEVISAAIAGGRDPTDILVLARNREPLEHLQQRLVERGIKVRLVGGRSLWSRSEIMDAIAYLSLVANAYDAKAFERAVRAPTDRKPFTRGKVKAPTRGVGEAGIAEIVAFAADNGIDLLEATLRCEEIPTLRASARAALREFAHALDSIRRASWESGATRPSVAALVDRALRIPGGVVSAYEQLRDNAKSRAIREDANRVLEDLRSLIRSANRYDEAAADEEPTIVGFLDTLGVEDTEEIDAEHDDRVTLSTIHSAKGTEAPTVIVIATEEDILPGYRQSATQQGVEDERKLFYTALTRAKETAFLIHTQNRAASPTSGPSRFLAEAGLHR